MACGDCSSSIVAGTTEALLPVGGAVIRSKRDDESLVIPAARTGITVTSYVDMILIDGQTTSAIHEGRFRARFPQLSSARGVVRDSGIIEFVLSRAGALASHVHLLSIRTYSKVKGSISAAGPQPAVDADPLLRSITRVIGDRDVVEVAGRGSCNPSDINRATVGAKRDDVAVVDPTWIAVPSL